MRVSIAVAISCFALVGTTFADDVRASIRKHTEIPAQDLDSALRKLANERQFQLIYLSESVESLYTAGAAGELTVDEALKQLLSGSGLVYRFVDDKTVSIFSASVRSGSPLPASTEARGTGPNEAGAPVKGASSSDSAAQAGQTTDAGKPDAKPSFWDRFRLAQVDQRSALESAAANTAPASASAQVEEVVVTAQKREESLQKVPIAISVLSGKDMDSATFTGVSEALNAVPGVSTTRTYSGGGTNIVIRGVGASFPLYTGASAVAYYLDSVPFGLVKSAIGPDADAYDLERVEVLRGPQGTLYGSSALNGVVRILTHRPDFSAFDWKGRVSGSSTQDGGGNYRIDQSVNVPLIADKLAARASVGYQHNSGWIDQLNEPDANGTNIATYRLKLAARPTDALSLGASAWSSHEHSGGPDLGYNGTQSASRVDQPSSTQYDAFGFEASYAFPGFTVTSLTSYLDYSNEGVLGLDVPGFGVPGAIYYTQSTSTITSEELNLNSTLDGPWRWSAGGMYRRGREDRNQSFVVLPVPDINYVDKSKSYAIYGELTRLFLDGRLELTAGLRHFHDDIDQYGRVTPSTPLIEASSTAKANTPRLLANWHMSDTLMAYVSYAEGFRSGFPQDPPVLDTFAAFPAVKPDRLKNYEVGAKGSLFDGALAFSAAAYHIDWKEIQLNLSVLLNNVPYPAVVNGANASGNGVDLELTLALGGLRLSPFVSWNDLSMSEDILSGTAVLYARGERPGGSPETTAGLGADYVVPMGQKTLRLSASASYTSTQSYRSIAGGIPVIKDSDDVLICRARAALDFSDRWTATIYGDNLTNWDGITADMFPGEVPDWRARVRPRTVGLQVEYRLR